MKKSNDFQLKLPTLPFWMGAFDEPNNPNGFPDTYPFELVHDDELGLLTQLNSKELDELLNRTYSFGSTVGNAMDDSPLGKAYCDDFMEFLETYISLGDAILEIGAGRAYLASRLIQRGYDVTAIEPGEVNSKYWKKYNVNVIQDFFPSIKAPGPFKAIIIYGVLEHIYEYEVFLSQVREYLLPTGIVLISVPNETIEIETGDPSMLLHEHFHYFTPSSLRRTLQKEGYYVSTQSSNYGRSIYAAARLKNEKAIIDRTDHAEILMNVAYKKKVAELMDHYSHILQKALDVGSVGIYCPARALAILPQNGVFRFFDDSEDLHGKFYPPFKVKIENRDELLSNPVDTLFIMTRTFGNQLYVELSQQLVSTKFYLLDDDV